MSSYEQPIDAQLIEQTKRQIQSLVAEIAQLSKQNITPSEFYQEFVNRLTVAMAAIGGAVWTTNDEGQLGLQYQVNLQQTGLGDSEDKQKRHGKLLYKALAMPGVRNGEGMLVPPHAGFGDEDEAGNPTDYLLVIGPLRTDLEMVGLVEIIQRSDASPPVQQGYLRFLLEMCGLASDFLKSHQLRHFSDRQVLWARLEDFTRGVHTSLEPVQTAYTIANEGRRLIECDRVSVAIRKGNRCTIEAVSGQDVFDKRSNTVRLLGRLATAVVASGDPVWYTGDTQNMAPQVEDAVQEYVDEAHSKMIAVLPLGRPKPDQEAERDEREDGEPPVGALIIEQIEDNRVAPSLAQRVEVVCRHSSSALANSMEHQSLFLMPVWRAIGKSRFLVKARTLPKTVSISLAVLAVLVLLIVWPANFDLHAKGTLEPVDRHDVFAGIEGTVYEIGTDAKKHKIDGGSWVHKGDLLVKLRNPRVEEERTKIDGDLQTARQHRYGILNLMTHLRAEEKQRYAGELAETECKIHGLEAQFEINKREMQELEVRSPIDGQVVTWDLDYRLMGRAVQKGTMLLRVANPAGPWEVELHMAEDRMGFVARAEMQAREEGKKLLVTYILATEPGTTLYGTVEKIGPTADIHTQDEGNVVLIKVKIDKNDIDHNGRDPSNLRPGAGVSGKVRCGRRSLGFVWFHDLLGFIQSRVLFKL